MIVSLLGSALGFASSFAPKVMDYFQDKQDKAHELKLVEAQTDSQLKLGEQRMEIAINSAQIEEIIAAHKEQASTVRKGSRWLANLSGSIRPVVTYVFVTEFVIINGAIAYLVLTGENGFTVENLKSILNEDFMGLLSAMVSFWFGNRTFGKRQT